MEKDWRLARAQEDYLAGLTLKYVTFPKVREFPEMHAHCEFCWATISPYAGDEQEAYQTSDGRFWICKNCFHDFNKIFCWKVE